MRQLSVRPLLYDAKQSPEPEEMVLPLYLRKLIQVRWITKRQATGLAESGECQEAGGSQQLATTGRGCPGAPVEMRQEGGCRSWAEFQKLTNHLGGTERCFTPLPCGIGLTYRSSHGQG